MRATASGASGEELTTDRTGARLPAGQAGVLLEWFLRHPDTTASHATLAAVLWGDGLSPSVARKRVFVVVSRLRRALAGSGAGLAVVTEPGGYRLVVEPHVVDVSSTKFVPPCNTPTGWLSRGRLVERMGAVGDVDFIAVTAPAGYGKSVLLAQWASAQRDPVGWVSLDPADNDPVRFWSAVLHGWAQTGLIDRHAVPASAVPGSERFAMALADELRAASRPVGIVFDDAHHIHNVELLAQFVPVWRRLPGCITVAVGSRIALPMLGQPPPHYAVRRLAVDDLCFDDDEVFELLQRDDRAVDPEDARTLRQFAHGWPIAVSHLAAARSRPSSSALLAEYVVDEVLSTLPPDTKRFVLATAHLERLPESLCDAVTGTGDAAEQLDRLRARGLFVIGDRYHQLIAEVLRQQASVDPTVDVADGHRRAARWYRDHQLVDDALAHACAADDRELIASLAECALATSAARGEIHTCRRWLRTLEPSLLLANPGAHDWATMLAGGLLEPEAADGWFASRAQLIDPGDDVAAQMARAHREYLSGRPGSLIVPPDEAIRRVRAYFADRRLGSEFAEVAVHALRVGAVCAQLLTGHVRYDDPEVAATASEIARSSVVHSLWLFGSWAFVAFVEGDPAMAQRLVGEVIGHVASLDATSAYLSAPALLATDALLESETTASAEGQRVIAARLEPLAAMLRQLRWDLELVPVLLALRTARRRAGETAVAHALTAEVDVVLALCEGTVVYERARAVLAAPERRPRRADVAELTALTALTARECEVLEQLDRGLTYGEIASELALSVNTVRSHLSAIYRKLGVRTRYGAVERWRARPPVAATTCARLDTPSLR